MGDRNMQAVGIIVADILPVHRTRAQRDAAQRAQFGKAIGRDLVDIGRHHLRHRRSAVILQPDEQEAVEILDLDRDKSMPGPVEIAIAARHWQARQATVQTIGPGMVGTDQLSGATRGPVH